MLFDDKLLIFVLNGEFEARKREEDNIMNI